jgi:hypothetical protein
VLVLRHGDAARRLEHTSRVRQVASDARAVLYVKLR